MFSSLKLPLSMPELIQWSRSHQKDELEPIFVTNASVENSPKATRAGLLATAFLLQKNPQSPYLDQLLDVLRSKHPHIVQIIEEERSANLWAQLTPEEFTKLNAIFPNYKNLFPKQLSLIYLYQNPYYPRRALFFIEKVLFERHGETNFFLTLERFLSKARLWSPLRDFYVRYLTFAKNPKLRHHAQQKALLLSTTIAPHPSHALTIIMNMMAHPQELSAELIQWTLSRFAAKKWTVQFTQLLEAIQSSKILGIETEPYRHAIALLSSRHPQTSFDLPSTLSQEEKLQYAQQLATFANHQPDPTLARRYLIQAAKLYADSDPQHSLDCWQTLLKRFPRSTSLWQELYNFAIPNERWQLLDSLLAPIDEKSLIIPSSSLLLLPLIEALQQNLLPHIDPLPFLIHSFLLAPHNYKRLKILASELSKRKEWLRLQKFYRFHLLSSRDHHSLKKAHLDYAHLLQHHLDDSQQAFRHYLMALSFDPNDQSIYSQLLKCDPTQINIPSFLSLLHSFALNDQGNLSFQLGVAKFFLQHTQHTDYAHQLTEHILQQHPLNQQAQQIWQQITHTPWPHQNLITSTDFPLPQIIEDLQEKLQPIVNFVERQKQQQLLLPLFKFLSQLPSQQSFRHSLLPKILQLSYLFEKHEQTLNILHELLSQHDNLHILDNFIETIKKDPKSPTFLKQLFEQTIPLYNYENYSSAFIRLNLYFIDLLFSLKERHQALQRLQQLLIYPLSPEELSELEEITIRFKAFPETAQILYRRIQSLETEEADNPLLPKLYLQLGELWREQLGDPQQALSFYQLAKLFDQEENPLILESLERALEETGDYHQWHQLLLERLPKAADRKEAAALYMKIALLERDKLEQPKLAFLHLKKAFTLDPSATVIHPILRQWAQEFHDEELVRELLLLELKNLSGSAEDNLQIVRLFTEMARSLERSGEQEKAFKVWLKVHTRDPHSIDALKALVRIYQQKRDYENARPLIETLIEANEQLLPSEQHYYRQLLAQILDPQLTSNTEKNSQNIGPAEKIISLCQKLDTLTQHPPLDEERFIEELTQLAQQFYAFNRPPMARATYEYGLKLLPQHPYLLQETAQLASHPHQKINRWIRQFLAAPSSIEPLLHIADVWKTQNETNGLTLLQSLLKILGQQLPFEPMPPSSHRTRQTTSLSLDDQFDLLAAFSFPPSTLKLLRELDQHQKLWLPSLPPPRSFPLKDVQRPELLDQYCMTFQRKPPHLKAFSRPTPQTPILALIQHHPLTFAIHQETFHSYPKEQQRFHLARIAAMTSPFLRVTTLLAPWIPTLFDALKNERPKPKKLPKKLWDITSQLCPEYCRKELPPSEEWFPKIQLAISQLAFLLSHSIEPSLLFLLDEPAAPIVASEFKIALRNDPYLQKFLLFAFSKNHLDLRKKLNIPLHGKLV